MLFVDLARRHDFLYRGMNQWAEANTLFEVQQSVANRFTLLVDAHCHNQCRIDGRRGDRLGYDRARAVFHEPGDAARRFRSEKCDNWPGCAGSAPRQKVVPSLIRINQNYVWQFVGIERDPLDCHVETQQLQLPR